MNPERQSGFVLILVLWMLVIVTLAAGYFAEQAARSVKLAELSQQNLQSLIDHADTRADVLFKLATLPMGSQGLGGGNGAIGLDDREYPGQGKVVYRIQDTRGLFNLNNSDSGNLRRFLAALEVPADQFDRLADRLADYMDADDLRRVNGAERKDYADLGLPPPANRRLLTVAEARRIPGWRNRPELWRENRLARLATVGQGLGINPNTAPRQVLQSLPNVSAELAGAMILRRQKQPFVNALEVGALSGANPMQLIFTLIPFPGDTVRVTQSLPGGGAAIEYEVVLTPQDDEAPWKITYSTLIAANGMDAKRSSDLAAQTER